MIERIRELVAAKTLGDRYDRADLTAFALGQPSDLERRLEALDKESYDRHWDKILNDLGAGDDCTMEDECTST